MKKIFVMGFIALLGFSVPSFGQSKADKVGHGIKKGANKAWHGTKKGAKAVGHETAELASKGKAKVTDKKSEQWIGPEGQTIYIDNANRYYWINGSGKRIYVSTAALRARNK
jgi:hypothetical protein